MSHKIEKLTKDKLTDWDSFCLASDEAWFWHTSGWLEYTLNYKLELNARNLSFLIYKRDKIAAVIPLTVEDYEKNGHVRREFSFGGYALPAPALANDLDKIEKDRTERSLIYDLIYGEIDRLAAEHEIKRAWFRQTPLAPANLAGKNRYNQLVKYGFIDVSLNTQLIDLSKSEALLWKDLRRNHRRNIKKADKFKTVIYDQASISPEIFKFYKVMHYKAAGRQTRPDKTFDLMLEWLKQGLAFLVAVQFDNKLIGFEYYSIYKNSVYGFSAANDPEYEKDYPIRHLLEWQAILWMKRQKFDFYEIGLQQYGATLFDFPDKKQLDISHFKKGFGGLTVPWFMGEKYYDKNYFLTAYRERLKKYAEKF